jgi:hypothetical protein
LSPRGSARTQPCSAADAAGRLRNARKFVEVAELIAREGNDVEYSSQAAALAVLAGVAASDAACCKALRRRSRGQDHRAAVELIETVKPKGKQAAKSLGRLLSPRTRRTTACSTWGGRDLKTALRQANDLVAFAEAIIQR